MKKFMIFLVLVFHFIFFVSCGSGDDENDNTDSGITGDSDSGEISDEDIPDTGTADADSGDTEAPDGNGDTAPDTDDTDTVPDSGEPEKNAEGCYIFAVDESTFGSVYRNTYYGDVKDNILGTDPFMAVVIGGLFTGCFLGICFLNNGSTGGTDNGLDLLDCEIGNFEGHILADFFGLAHLGFIYPEGIFLALETVKDGILVFFKGGAFLLGGSKHDNHVAGFAQNGNQYLPAGNDVGVLGKGAGFDGDAVINVYRRNGQTGRIHDGGDYRTFVLFARNRSCSDGENSCTSQY